MHAYEISKDVNDITSHTRFPCAQTIILCIFSQLIGFPNIELIFAAAEWRIHPVHYHDCIIPDSDLV